MKFLIILAIALNLVAEPKQSSEKIFKPGNKEYNTEIGNFLRELQKEWNEINKNIKLPKFFPTLLVMKFHLLKYHPYKTEYHR